MRGICYFKKGFYLGKTAVPPPQFLADSHRKRVGMDPREFEKEMENMKEDIEDFFRPYSPCEYFHGREKLFGEGQLKKAVEFFLEYQQKKFERKGRDEN